MRSRCFSAVGTVSVTRLHRVRKTVAVPFAKPMTTTVGVSREYTTLTAAVFSLPPTRNSYRGTTVDDAKSQISSAPSSVTMASSVERHGHQSKSLIGSQPRSRTYSGNTSDSFKFDDETAADDAPSIAIEDAAAAAEPDGAPSPESFSSWKIFTDQSAEHVAKTFGQCGLILSEYAGAMCGSYAVIH